MIRPPSHRIDALPIVVVEQDTAWDRLKVSAELEALGDDALRHPFIQYHHGATRYDLSAEITTPDGVKRTVLDYLDLAQAWQFHGRRLKCEEVHRLQPMLTANPGLAFLQALKLSLVKIEGPGAPEIKRDSLGGVSDDTVEMLFQLCSGLPSEVGQALLLASMPLTAAEKKP